jgi:hypothetical protein
MVNKVPSGVPHKFYLSRLIGIYVLFVALRPAPCAMPCPGGNPPRNREEFFWFHLLRTICCISFKDLSVFFGLMLLVVNDISADMYTYSQSLAN